MTEAFCTSDLAQRLHKQCRGGLPLLTLQKTPAPIARHACPWRMSEMVQNLPRRLASGPQHGPSFGRGRRVAPAQIVPACGQGRAPGNWCRFASPLQDFPPVAF